MQKQFLNEMFQTGLKLPHKLDVLPKVSTEKFTVEKVTVFESEVVNNTFLLRAHGENNGCNCHKELNTTYS